jgi:hypothetical protein
VFWGLTKAASGGGAEEGDGLFPVVVSTWPFREAVRAAWELVSDADGGGSAVDAVVAGCSACEVLRCDGTGQSLACGVYLVQSSNATIVVLTKLLSGRKPWCCMNLM